MRSQTNLMASIIQLNWLLWPRNTGYSEFSETVRASLLTQRKYQEFQFLSLRFYVKSISNDLEVLKLLFLPFNVCYFGKFGVIKLLKFTKIKFRTSKMGKNGIFERLITSNFDFT